MYASSAMGHERAAAGPETELVRGGYRLTRREVLQCAGAVLLGAGLAPRGAALATGDQAAFAAVSLQKVLNVLGVQPQDGPQVVVAVPDFVENGAIVPVEVTTHLPGAQSIYILSESNPFPLVAHFLIPDGTEPFVATRIKVAQSCKVYAIVNAGDQWYWAFKSTQVTIGGCGG